MSDFTTSKPPVGDVYPAGNIQAEFRDIEPLLTPQQLKDRFLWGIPLVSPIPDPITKKAIVMSSEQLQDVIMRAVALAEQNNFFIFPRHVGDKYPWDRQLFQALGYLKLEKRPCSSIEKFEVRPADNSTVFSMPLQWIETAYLAKGQINIVPINIAAVTGGQVLSTGGSGNGAFFLTTMGSMGWVPAYWYVEYTVGFPDGKVPRIVNEAVGQQAAILVLQQLQAARALWNSKSTSIDGSSSSVSGQAGQTYKAAIELLQQQLTATMRKLKVAYGLTFFSSAL